MNFGGLKYLLTQYLHRSDMETVIPTFISMAGARISRDLDVPELEKRVSLTLGATVQYFILPTDFREMTSFRASGTALFPLTSVQMAAVYPTVRSGAPKHYTLIGATEAEVLPVPTADTPVELRYKYQLADFLTDNASNWLLTRSPAIYVYASLLEAILFTQGDERAAVMEKYYLAEIDRENERGAARRMSGGPIQIMNLGVSTP